MITDVSDLTSFKWATVTATVPLAIRLDGDTAALALVPDSLMDPQTLSVGDRVRVELSMRKVVVHGVANSGTEPGRVELTAATNAPKGWLVCNGGSYARSAYPRLFAVIGTTYGAANSDSFSVPDLRGRVAVGGDAAQAEFNALGRTGGEKAHTLTAAEMNHKHYQTMAFTDSYITANGLAYTNGGTIPANARETGDARSVTASAHNVLQPYLTLNYIIKF